MSHLFTWLFYWIGLAAFVLATYWLTVTGRLYCAALFIGHVWAVLKEEVARPMRVIKKALNRKKMIELDEYERHLS